MPQPLRRLNPSSKNAGEAEQFADATQVEPGEGVILARAADANRESYWAGMPWKHFFTSHGWVTGASGSGKTFFIIALIMQILKYFPEVPIIIPDMKGELTSFLLNVLLPALGISPSRVRVIRPFDSTYLPQLRITAPEEGIGRDIQAMGLTTAIEQGLASEIGNRMGRILLHMVALAVEFNLPLTVLKHWIEQPCLFVAVAKKSDDQNLRAYGATYLERESKLSVDALLSRLDTFLFMHDTQLCLSASSCVSFADALTGGITPLDLGDPPAGVEKVARFWAGVLIGKLTRAVLSRPVTEKTPPAVVIYEEVQECFGHDRAEQFGRLLALARYKKVALIFVNQQASQVASVSPYLVRLLQTNTRWQAVFRCNMEDARSFTAALPFDGRDERKAMMRDLAHLPRRAFYLCLKEAAFGPQRVLSPKLDLETLKKRAAAVDPVTRDAIRRGTIAVPRAELEQLIVPPPLPVLEKTPRKVVRGNSPNLG